MRIQDLAPLTDPTAAHARGRARWLVALGAGVLLAACSTEEPKEEDTGTTVEDVADTTADTAVDTSTGADVTDAADTATGGDADVVSGGDADGSAQTDTGPTICTSDEYCKGALKATLMPCETARCNEGTCQPIYKPGTCCNDSQCDDGVGCTVDKCDLGTNTCENKAKPNCCAGQEVFLDVGFEQQSFEEFKAVEGPNNGSVKWSLSNARSHTGKNALYLGNPCKTYDTSMTPESECVPGASKKAVSSSLSSKEVILPPGKQAVAHFWIWIEAEKMFTDVLGAGSCQPCKKGQSCVKLPDGDQCVDEYDVVRVYVDTTGPAGDPVWISTEVGKSTDGWHHVSINLAPFQNPGVASAVKLRWDFAANNANNQFEGVYIDDVVIETLCAGEGTLCDKDNPCKDDSNGCTSEACTTFANDKSTGICFYDQTPGCCVAVTDCNDKNDCTIDKCNKADEATQGTCDHVPDASNAACCQPSETFSDGFESGQIASWQHINTNSKSVKWQHNAQAGATGKASMYFGNGTFTGYDDPSLGAGKGPRGTVCSKPVKINPGTVYNVLNFNLKLKTEWSGQDPAKYKNPPELSDVKLDELRVEVALPTGLEVAWSSDAVAGTTDDKWLPIIVSLDKWAGQTVGVCFTFDAGDAYGNTEGGVWIDDVAVNVECTKQECSIADQCKAKCGACETPSCDSGACSCTKKPDCCEGSIDCDDGDKCTTDACVDNLCKHELGDPKCCSDKVGDNAILSQDFEGAKLPAGWKPSKLAGQPPFGSGASYDQNIVWNVSTLKSSKTTGSYSMCFADAAGTYNGGPNVPAGRVVTAPFVVPTNGTTIVSFDLFLDTEWSDNPFKVFPFAVDQLVVNAVDTAEADAEKARTLLWDSYDIEGSTKGQWKGVVAEIPTKLAGKTIRLEWYFDAGNANKNVYQGACFDNVSVETLCTKPICVADQDCVPSTPDSCKSYGCAKKEGKFECVTSFKPGEGCCQPSVGLATENGEGGSLVKWKGSALPADGAVKWQVVPHKYLVGNKEIYFGNVSAGNYAAGSGKSCATTPDCPSGETCLGGVGKKVCGVAVKGELLSDTFTLSKDNKKSAQLRFRLYLDVEPGFETFEVYVVNEFGVETKAVWSKNNPTDFDPKSMKSVVEKIVNLDAFKTGDPIALKFKFDSVDSSKNEQFEGIYLDELIVEEPCKP